MLRKTVLTSQNIVNKKYKITYMTEICPVCYCELEKDRNYVITSCMHIFCFFCIARLLRENQNATCPMCREILFQSTENIRRQQLSSSVNVDINFTENTDGTINPQIEINIDGNQNNRENAAGLIQRSVSSRLRNIHPDL